VVESISSARKGTPKYGLDSKETLKEEELYPAKRLAISYLTARSIAEILKCKIGL